jgi:hypothetical protein
MNDGELGLTGRRSVMKQVSRKVVAIGILALTGSLLVAAPANAVPGGHREVVLAGIANGDVVDSALLLGVVTAPGETVTVSCPSTQQVGDATATYYRRGKELKATSVPILSDPSADFPDEFRTVSFVTPKNADYVVIDPDCQPASQIIVVSFELREGAEQTIYCPAGTTVDSYEIIEQTFGEQFIVLQDATSVTFFNPLNEGDDPTLDYAIVRLVCVA